MEGDLVAEYFPSFLDLLFWSRIIAPEYGAQEIGPQHLLLGWFRGPLVAEAEHNSLHHSLKLSGDTCEELKIQIDEATPRGRAYVLTNGDIPLNGDAQQLLERARELAEKQGDPAVQPLHLLWAVLNKGGELSRLLEKAGVTVSLIEGVLRHSRRKLYH